MILLNALLLGGLAAAGLPLLVHLLHRRKARRVDWGAMRFVALTLLRARRSLFLEQFLLLAVRTLILATFALALARPALLPRDQGQERIVRHGRTAAVLCLDDSLSLAVQGRRDAALELALAYLDTLRPGDEVVLLPLSACDEPPAEALHDLEAVRRRLHALQPGAHASDQPRLLAAGMRQIALLSNPNAELVLIGDGFDDGYPAGQAAWADLQGSLCRDQRAASGTPGRPRLVVLTPLRPGPRNLSVGLLECTQEVLPAGSAGVVRVGLDATGLGPTPFPATVGLRIDGRPLARRTVAVSTGRTPLELPLPPLAVGLHTIEVCLEDARDALPADDARTLVVQAVRDLPVLLVDSGRSPGLGGLDFVAHALRPTGSGVFAPRRVAVEALTEADIAGASVVALAGPPPLGHRLIGALERFVAEGGGLLIAAGDDPGAEATWQALWRSGTGVLPLAVGAVSTLPQPQGLVLPGLDHPLAAAFAAAGISSLPAVHVRTLRILDPKRTSRSATACQVLVTTGDGQPVVAAAQVGRGQVAVLAVAPDRTWSDLPLEPGFVPLMRHLVMHLAGNLVPPRNLTVGDRLVAPASTSTAANAGQTVRALGPDGREVPLASGRWKDRPALVSPALTRPGLVVLHRDGTTSPYAVRLAPEESRCRMLDAGILDRLGAMGAHHLSSVASVQRALGGAAVEPVEWTCWLLLACLVLIFVEILMTGRLVTRDRLQVG